MKIKFNARKFNLTDDVKERFQKKLSKLDRFFPSDLEATVALYEEKLGERVEVTIRNGSTIFRAEQTDKDVACALDDVMDVLERQIRRNRTRLEKKKQISKEAYMGFGDDVAEEEIKVSKVKQFELTPMTVEEAVLQMNLLSHSFYVFKNAETDEVNVVYKRKNNDYGVIEPK